MPPSMTWRTPTRRHSLVTPIDWKPVAAQLPIPSIRRRHSLVTPIDWKHEHRARPGAGQDASRHSLVTPIDWKPEPSVRG